MGKTELNGFNFRAATMAKRQITTKTARSGRQSFAQWSRPGRELHALRSKYAQSSEEERRAAAEWAYDESISAHLLGRATAQMEGGSPFAPQWPAGFAALAIDPHYPPALLTVGCYEYDCGRQAAGLNLLLQLPGLPPGPPDWVEIIDKAGQFLVERSDAEAACGLFEAALKVRPDDQSLIVGMGWALCRAGQQAQALPWLKRVIANAPEDSSAHNDYGWALLELGLFDEAEAALEEAVRLAPGDYDLPANNLKRLRQLQQRRSHATDPRASTLRSSNPQRLNHDTGSK